ncbi:hypothetical protein KRP22_013602 [Phytophthora ramorum]|nr:hypothetical protein KRP22_11220 [Phytophthora ramorum]
MRCRRTPPPDALSVSRFHEALHHGQVDAARRLLFRDPLLANARSSSSPRVTSLMVSATSPSASLKSIKTLVKMLLAKGASLRTKDDHRRHVFMAVCASGAHPHVLQSLLDWGGTSDHRALLWSDRDDQGRTALGLACLHGHGRLASYVLDLLTPDEEVGPLHALNFALRSGDERCVLELLRHRKVQWVIRNNRRVDKLTAHGEWNQSHRVESGDDDVSVSSCVAAAVEKEMVRAVHAMHRLNRHCVGHATWFALCSEVETCSRGKTDVVRRPGPVRPEFDEIAALYRRDCIWERIQIVFLMRYAPDRSAMKRGLVRLNIVAELPDAVFRIVAEFLKPKFNDAEEVQKERFKTVLNLSSW